MKFNHIKKVVVHDNCPDGLASAILLKDAFFGENVEILFVQHGTAEYLALQPKPGMLFCDIAPAANPETVKAWVEAGTVVLDHHRKVEGLVRLFVDAGLGAFGHEKDNPGVCGAVLAYNHVWLPRRGTLAIQDVFASKFARLAGIRDTYQRHSPEWEEASLQAEVLTFFPRERWLSMTLTEMAARWDKEFRPIGEVLLQKKKISVEKTIEKSWGFTTQKGTRVITFNKNTMTTDVADYLGDQVDLVLGFSYLTEGTTQKLVVSTRGQTGFDCNDFCAKHGGGGHTRAAGFSKPLSNYPGIPPYDLMQHLVEEYESV